MHALIDNVLAVLQREPLGMIGGTVFFGSWMLQAWESRRAGSPVVSPRFFTLRALASALMSIEGLRSGSVSVFVVMFATMILMLYNLWLAWRRT